MGNVFFLSLPGHAGLVSEKFGSSSEMKLGISNLGVEPNKNDMVGWFFLSPPLHVVFVC